MLVKSLTAGYCLIGHVTVLTLSDIFLDSIYLNCFSMVRNGLPPPGRDLYHCSRLLRQSYQHLGTGNPQHLRVRSPRYLMSKRRAVYVRPNLGRDGAAAVVVGGKARKRLHRRQGPRHLSVVAQWLARNEDNVFAEEIVDFVVFVAKVCICSGCAQSVLWRISNRSLRGFGVLFKSIWRLIRGLCGCTIILISWRRRTRMGIIA
ncbi:hypothetical protein KC362_g23 [Hortaea werneckii]|nr:hypothetical protein KC362_g23 [Hortaea werneckii]